MTLYFGIIYGAIIISIIATVLLFRYVFKQSKGTPEMQSISTAIKDGAMAFLKRQYKTISLIAVIACRICVHDNYTEERYCFLQHQRQQDLLLRF